MVEADNASDRVTSVSSCHCIVHCNCPLQQVRLSNMAVNSYVALLPVNTL